MSYEERLAYERNGFDSQSYVNKAFNTVSFYLLWNPSWRTVDRERLRQAAVEKNAQEAAKVGLRMRGGSN